MTAGMSLSERIRLRERYRQAAIEQAAKRGVTLRCQHLADDMDNPGHRLCQGEQPGGAGCLCRCHDNRREPAS